MKKTTLILVAFLLASIIAFAWLSKTARIKRTITLHAPVRSASYTLPGHSLQKIKLKAEEARSYASGHGFNETICFLVDMSLPSGESRFFVYNLKKDTLQNSGLVTHGRCNENWLEGRRYGNTVGCGCTSLGKYKIGYSYNGRFGLAFKLYGLDKTNDKAFDRFVVLHSHACVPETEIKDDICQSDGCPTVAPGYLQQLKPIIAASKKPVLLWIFE